MRRSTSYWTVLVEGPAGPAIASFGHYEDELARCPDGRWRFAVRRGFTQSRIPADG